MENISGGLWYSIAYVTQFERGFQNSLRALYEYIKKVKYVATEELSSSIQDSFKENLRKWGMWPTSPKEIKEWFSSFKVVPTLQAKLMIEMKEIKDEKINNSSGKKRKARIVIWDWVFMRSNKYKINYLKVQQHT